MSRPPDHLYKADRRFNDADRRNDNADRAAKRPRYEQYTHNLRGPGISGEEIHHTLLEREHARRMRDYGTADRLRNKLNSHGIRVFDKQGEWSAADGRRGRVPSASAANAGVAASQGTYPRRRMSPADHHVERYGNTGAGATSRSRAHDTRAEDVRERRASAVALGPSQHEALSSSGEDDDGDSHTATAAGAAPLLPHRASSCHTRAPVLSSRAHGDQSWGSSSRGTYGGGGGGGGRQASPSWHQGATTHRAHDRGQRAPAYSHRDQLALREHGRYRSRDSFGAQTNAREDANKRGRGWQKRSHASANRNSGSSSGRRRAVNPAVRKSEPRVAREPLEWGSLQRLQVMTAPALPAAATAAKASGDTKANTDPNANTDACTVPHLDAGAVQARWQKSSSGLGAKLLMKQGWAPGKGLGRDGNGMVEPFSMNAVGFAEQDLGVRVSRSAGATTASVDHADHMSATAIAGSNRDVLQAEERYALVPMRLEGEGLGFGSSGAGGATGAAVGAGIGAGAGAGAGAATSSGSLAHWHTSGQSTVFSSASAAPPQLSRRIPVAVLDMLFGRIGRAHSGDDSDRCTDGCLPPFLDDVELCVVSALVCRAWKSRCLCRPYRRFISFRQDGYTVSIVLEVPPDVARIADSEGSVEAELRQQCPLPASSQSVTASERRYALEVRARTGKGESPGSSCLVRGSLLHAADKLLGMKWLLDGEDDSKEASAGSSAGSSRGLRLVVQLAKVEKWALWRSGFVGNAPPPMLPLEVAPTFTSQVTYVALPAASKRLPPLEHTALLASLPGSQELQAFVAHKCGLDSATWSGSYLEPNDASEMVDRNGSRVRGIMVWASRCQDSAEAPHQDVSRLAADGWRKGGIRAVRGDAVLLMVRTKPMDMLESLTLKEYRRMFDTHGSCR